jgi:hypothetical protein
METTIDVSGLSEAEAVKAARKAVRDVRKAESDRREKMAVAQSAADKAALKVFLAYHREYRDSSFPAAWEYRDAGDVRACMTHTADGGLCLHGESGSADWIPGDFKLQLSGVIESAAGVFVAIAYDRYTDRILFLAVGMYEGQLASVELPEDVGAWLRHKSSENS